MSTAASWYAIHNWRRWAKSKPSPQEMEHDESWTPESININGEEYRKMKEDGTYVEYKQPIVNHIVIPEPFLEWAVSFGRNNPRFVYEDHSPIAFRYSNGGEDNLRLWKMQHEERIEAMAKFPFVTMEHGNWYASEMPPGVFQMGPSLCYTKTIFAGEAQVVIAKTSFRIDEIALGNAFGGTYDQCK